MKKIILTKEEINQLRIGEKELSNIKGGRIDDDIVNENGFTGCKCTYKNTSATINDNTWPGCKCVCV
jgi:hypothetical protein